MKITKRQLKQIITELGISRHERDARLDDPDDLTLGVETWETIVDHLQALNDIIASEAANQTVEQHAPEVDQIKTLLPWAQDHLDYWRK